MRPGPVPTWDQMRVLADRAEGGLTPAEASRLRAGIRAAAEAEASRRSVSAQLAVANRRVQQQARQLAAVRDLVGRTRSRGAQAVAVWALTRVLAPGQQPPAATSVGTRSASATAGLSRTGPEKGAVRPPNALSAIRRPPPGTASRAAV